MCVFLLYVEYIIGYMPRTKSNGPIHSSNSYIAWICTFDCSYYLVINRYFSVYCSKLKGWEKLYKMALSRGFITFYVDLFLLLLFCCIFTVFMYVMHYMRTKAFMLSTAREESSTRSFLSDSSSTMLPRLWSLRCAGYKPNNSACL